MKKVFVLPTEVASLNVFLREKFGRFGVLPQCRFCKEPCKQYNDPGITYFRCAIKNVSIGKEEGTNEKFSKCG